MTWPTTRPLALIEPDAQLVARIPIGEAEEVEGEDARVMWVFWCLRHDRGDLAEIRTLRVEAQEIRALLRSSRESVDVEAALSRIDAALARRDAAAG